MSRTDKSLWRPEIHSTKTSAMRKLLHLVSHGYTFWCSGEIDPRKLEGLDYKFMDRYQTTRTSQQCYRANKSGKTNVKTVYWKSGDVVLWWLLATKGDGVIYQLENMNNAENRNQRITILCDYELAKTPRKNHPARWSWRMTNSCSENWKNRIKKAIRQKDRQELRQIFYSLKRIPGFHNLRREAFKFSVYAESEWKRLCKGSFPQDAIYIGWLGKFRKADLVEDLDPK